MLALGLGIGLFCGVMFGMMISALCIAAKRADECQQCVDSWGYTCVRCGYHHIKEGE